jgi:putative Mg2+ transporter-C (MgtC) family protein
MDGVTSYVELLARLVLALALGGVIGWERERAGKPAGLRTHMMVSLGAATFTLIAIEIYESVAADPHDVARLDPIRLLQGIVGGIGFLGAGSIIRGPSDVEGLTTAGSIWFIGAVGVAAGAGSYRLAGTAAVLGLLVLLGMGIIERRWYPKKERR